MALGRRAPALLAARPRLLDVGAFLVWRATGRCATSLGSADATGLVDMRARSWSTELCALGGLAPTALPDLVEPGALIGPLAPEVASRCGLRAGLPVVAGLGDGQAAGLGAGLVGPGRAYLNLGTAVVAGVLSTEYRCDPAFRTLYGALRETFLCESDLKGGTFLVTWLLERLLGTRASTPCPPAELRRVLVDLFPVLRDTRFTHAWGGNLGIPRDWYPSVGFDPRTGLAWAGGYVGDGVATANLAGRTLADLIAGEPSDLTRLPWVNRRSRRWEPEPLRWLGVNAVTALMWFGDQQERRTGRPSRPVGWFWRSIGH